MFISIKWKSQIESFELQDEALLSTLKTLIEKKFNIQANKQTLVWKSKPKSIKDTDRLIDIQIVNNATIMLIGTIEEDIKILQTHSEKNEIQEQSLQEQSLTDKPKAQKEELISKKLPQKPKKINTVKPDSKYNDKRLMSIDDVAVKCSVKDSLLNISNEFRITVQNIVKHTKTKIDCNLIISRLVFRWICDNIAYDIQSWLKEDYSNTTNLNHIFASKKTCCAGYALLFQEFCILSGMNRNDVKIIDGVAKGLLKSGESLIESDEASLPKDYKTNHAWNIVKIDNKWELIDATWSSGSLVNTGGTNDYEFVKCFNDFFFCVAPEHLIFTHFPREKQYTFMTQDVKFSEWIRLPYVYPAFFILNFRFCDPNNMPTFDKYLKIEDTQFNVKFITPNDIIIQGVLINSENENDMDHYAARSIGTPIDTSQKNSNIVCDLRHKQGKYKLVIFAGQINDCNYPICTYLLQIN